MDIKGLKEWVMKEGLEEKTILGFWNTFKNYQKAYHEEFLRDFQDYDSKHVTLNIDNVALRITNWPDEDYSHVVVSVRIHYKDNYAGMYRMVFTLTGEVDDDHLSLF
ncbi:hypothetical protein ACFU8X_21525 [Brevibacillus porteri]|uniref:hypothetical protein n=1 Tax=Brevibacillus porteri TaxID=2126350 RepID=UPI00370C46E3